MNGSRSRPWLLGRKSARAVGLGLLAACLLRPRPGSAQVPTRLVYVRSQGTSDCPGQTTLEAAVAERLGYEPFSPWGDQTIIATISPSNGGLLARAELVDHDGVAQGSRQVQARRSACDELVAALALAISITLDPTHVVAQKKGSSKSDALSASDPPPNDLLATEHPPAGTSLSAVPEPPETAQLRPHSVAPSHETHTEPPRPRQTEVSLHVHAGVFGALALVPDATLGARVGGGLRHGPFSLWLAGEATLPRAEGATQDSEVRINLLASELALCGEVLRPFSLCSLTLLGTMRGEGVGVSAPKRESSFYASVGARGLLVVPLSPVFALLGNAELSAVLTRPTFQLEGMDVWKPAALTFGAGLGISGRFL